MKMFPHAFVPFFHPLENEAVRTEDTKGKTSEASVQQYRTFRKKPVIVDVEKAVDVMLVSSAIQNDKVRDQFRLAVIKSIPAEVIDWDSINWVQMCPFQANRA